jgi:hypothetical protein
MNDQTVLVVDHDSRFSGAFKVALRMNGFASEVVSVDGGQEALNWLFGDNYWARQKRRSVRDPAGPVNTRLGRFVLPATDKGGSADRMLTRGHHFQFRLAPGQGRGQRVRGQNSGCTIFRNGKWECALLAGSELPRRWSACLTIPAKSKRGPGAGACQRPFSRPYSRPRGLTRATGHVASQISNEATLKVELWSASLFCIW